MKKQRPVTVADLKDQFSTPYPRPILYCRVCGEENSAHAGDYWSADPKHVFKHCGRNMVLVTKRVVMEPTR